MMLHHDPSIPRVTCFVDSSWVPRFCGEGTTGQSPGSNFYYNQCGYSIRKRDGYFLPGLLLTFAQKDSSVFESKMAPVAVTTVGSTVEATSLEPYFRPCLLFRLAPLSKTR